MSNKKYNPAKVLHLQQQNSGNNYNPRTAGEFWKIKKEKLVLETIKLTQYALALKKITKLLFCEPIQSRLISKVPKMFLFCHEVWI